MVKDVIPARDSFSCGNKPLMHFQEVELALITVEMFVPPSYMPPEDGEMEIVNQHMVFTLQMSLPGPLAESRDELPYLWGYDFAEPDIIIRLIPDPALTGEYRFVFYIYLWAPNSEGESELKEVLSEVILRAFDSRLLPRPQISIRFVWRSE